MKIAVISASGKLGAGIARQLIQEIGKDQVIGIVHQQKQNIWVSKSEKGITIVDHNLRKV